MPNDQEFESLIAELQHQKDVVRIHATQELGKLKDKRAVAYLISALETAEDWEEQATIIEVLGQIGDERAVEPLLQLLENDDYDQISHVADALGQIGDKRAIEPLLEIAYRNASAALALGQIGDKQAVEILMDILFNSDVDISWAAAVALGEIGDERAIPALRRAFSTGAERDRICSAIALGQLGDKDSIQPLIETCLTDNTEELDRACLEGLGKLDKKFEPLPDWYDEGLVDKVRMVLVTQIIKLE